MRYRHLRRTAIALLAAVAFVLVLGVVLRAVLNLGPLRRWVIGRVENLAVARGVALEVGDLHWGIWPPGLELEGVHLKSSGLSCRIEWLGVDLERVRVARRTIDLGTVAAQGVDLELDAGSARPLPARAGPPRVRFTIEQLDLRQLRLAGRHLPGVERVVLDHLDLAWTNERRGPRGWLRAAAVHLDADGIQPVDLALGLRFEIADVIRLPHWWVKGSGFHFAGGGYFSSEHGLHQLIDGELELAELDRVVRAGEILEGSLSLHLKVNTQAERPVTGRVRSPRVTVEGFEVEDFAAALALGPQGLSGEMQRGSFAGGRLRGSYRLESLAAPFPHRVNARLEGAELSRVLDSIDVPAAGLAAAVDIRAEMGWNSDRFPAGFGHGRARFTPRGDGLAVAGELDAELRGDGMIHFATEDLALGASRCSWQGPLSLGSWQPEWSIRAQPAVLEELVPVVNSWIGSTVLPSELTGSGFLQLGLSGPWDRLHAGIRLDAETVSYAPMAFDRVVAEAQVQESVLQLDSVRVGVAGGFGEVAGSVRWQVVAPEEEVDLSFRGSQLELGRLLEWLGVEHGASGLVSFTGGLRGTLDHPRGSWALGLEQVEALGQMLGDGAATVDLVDGRFGVNGLRFDQGLEASARWAVLENELEGRLHWPQMPLGGFGATATTLVGEQVDLEMAFEWPLATFPSGHLELSAPELQLTARADGRQLKLEGRLADAIQLSTELKLQENGALAGPGRLQVQSLTPLLDRLQPEAEIPLSGGGLVAFQVFWPAASLPRLEGELRTLDLELDQSPVVLLEAAPFTFSEEGLRVAGLHLERDDDRVFARATVGADGSLRGNLAGTGDALLLRMLVPEWEPAGRFTGVVELFGSITAPRFEGIVDLDGASFRIPGSRSVVSSIDGTVLLAPGELELEGMHFRFLRGAGRASGRVFVDDGEVQLALGGDVDNLAYPLFSGFEPRLSGSWRLEGPVSDLLLSGDLTVIRAALSRRDNPANILLDWVDESEEASAPGGLSVDLRVESDNTLEARGPFLNLVGSALLSLGGPVDDLGITGKLEFEEGGDFSFQGVRYEIERASVTFVDPESVEAVVDLQARAWVQNYQITVRLNGSLDHLVPSVSSDPPLDEAGIYSLLALSHRDEALGAGAMGVGLASALLTRQINAELEERARLILPVDQVRLDPFVESSTGNPAARVTLVKQLTPTWTVILQSNLSNERQEVIVSRWYLAQGVFVEAIRDLDGTLGIDLKLRRRY